MVIRGRLPWNSDDAVIAVSTFKPSPQAEINKCLSCGKSDCDNCICNDPRHKKELLKELLSEHVTRREILQILQISKTTYLRYKKQIFA